ncbi:MAG: sulfotransferase family protein [Bacteroidales bacterium]|nr:sulfotransferase family protein [Bacteroidales bacterium]MCF6341741.1 sulfotransferase family protein [Bacteroidales bacterium]
MGLRGLVCKESKCVDDVGLISIHIPKTAGRSFYETLKFVYGSELDARTKRKDYFLHPEQMNQSFSLYPGIKVIHGHLYYSEIRFIHKKNNSVKLICWLRNPVDRVISHYYFFLKRISEGKVQAAQLHKADFSLIEFARLDSVRNVISRFVDGLSLDDFFFIGHVESFQTDLNLLANKLQWPSGLPVVHVNKRDKLTSNQIAKTKYEGVSNSIRNEIWELNREDVKVYEQSLELKNTVED